MAGSQLEAVSAEVFTSRITSRNVTIRKPEACPEARYKVYPGSTYHLFATKQIGTGGLSPISYWHEFLDMIFFFKVVTGTVRVSPSVVLPQVLVTRTTRSNSNRNFSHFISRKCNTVTFQRSFLIEPPESGTPSQMNFNCHTTFRSVNSNPLCITTM